MTVEELGAVSKGLANAVLARDYMAVIAGLGKAHVALSEFLAGWSSQPRGSGEDYLDPISEAAEQLISACGVVDVGSEARSASPAAGFNPMWIPVILEAVKMFAELLKRIRDNRPQP